VFIIFEFIEPEIGLFRLLSKPTTSIPTHPKLNLERKCLESVSKSTLEEGRSIESTIGGSGENLLKGMLFEA
jgi:hypothetical protein